MFPAILLITFLKLISTCLAESSSSSNYANLATLTSESFSLRSQIELYDNGMLKASVRTWEQYSRLEQRAVVELDKQDSDGQVGASGGGAGGRVIYYHDANSMVWLRWAKTKCLGSSRMELETAIYGNELPDNVSHLLINSNPDFNHLIGAAQLMLAINDVCKSSFALIGGGGGGSGEPRMIRGFETVAYGCELEGGIKLEILYAPFGGNSSRPDGMPISLKLALTTSRTIVINFYHLKKLESVPTPLSKQTTTSSSATNEKVSLNLPGEGSFLFPLGLGCGRVLREMAEHHDTVADERDLMQKSIQSVSFRARYPSSGSATGTGNGKWVANQQHQEENLLVSFNMRAKLLRRETTISLDESMEQHKGAKSVTIYDFGPRRTKYNLVSTFSYKARDYNYSLSNIVDEGSEVTDCVAMPMQKISNNDGEESELEFVKFERLQYMGLAQVDGVEVGVYEDDHLDRIPFWFDPTVLLEDGNQKHSGKSLELKDVALIYYFAASDNDGDDDDDENSGGRRWLDNLLRIDIIIRDPQRNFALLMNKEVRIFNFIWNQLIGSPLGVRKLDLFSLNSNCVSDRKSLRSAHLAMYLESTASSRMLEENNSLDIHDWNRNEAILRALATNFHLPQTHIDHIKSSIVQTFNQKFIANIRLEFRANDFENLKQVQCRELGRGQFLTQDHLMQSDAFTFEDCLWFANYCSDRIKDEIVFAHDEDRSLCLVDRLYRWRDLQYHEARLADTNRLKSLNYFPYEYGNHVMYKLSYPESPNNNDFLEKLKSFDHIVGQQLSLILDYTNSKSNPSRQVNYTIEQVKVVHNQHESGNKQTGGRFKNLGWYHNMESSNDQRPDLLKKVELTESQSPYSHQENPIAAATSGAWTEALCQYYCLVDMECKSYSYCERASTGRTECVLSKLDVGQPEVAEQLGSIQTQLKARIWRGNNKIKRISLPPAATGSAATTVLVEHIFVQIDRRCSIQAKMYAKLFDKGHQTTKIDLAKQPEVLSVAGQDECAAKCFARNLDYLKGLLRHKLDLNRVYDELTQIIKSNHEHTSELASSFDDKLDSATNWHHGHLKSICSHFMYADDINNNSTKNSCILSGSRDRTNDMTMPWVSGGGDKRNHSTIAINVHRMIFGHLYERMQGFRLAEAAPIQPTQVTRAQDDDDDASVLAKYTRRLEFYQTGRNTQIQLATDSIEHCARVCTLQTHGPRPACSSFDYVHERGRSNSTGRKYCLLNSQSLHDLRRVNMEDQQVVYSDHLDRVQFWHYEPRDSLLVSMDNQDDDGDDDNDYSLLSDMIARLDRSIIKQTFDKREAFRGISLAIALFGILSGLFLGIRLVEFSESMYNMDEMKFKNSVIRTIHRLSGVSLGLGVRDSEVQM